MEVLPEGMEWRQGVDVQLGFHSGRYGATPQLIRIPAVVPNHLGSLVRDVLGDGRKEVRSRGNHLARTVTTPRG